MNRHDPVNIGEISNLYRRSIASAKRWAGERLSRMGGSRQPRRGTFESRQEIGLEVVKRRVEQLPAGDDHDVHPSTSRYVRTPKNLSYQSFSSITSDRVPEFPGSNDAEPRGTGVVWAHQDREIPPFGPQRQVEYALEFTTAPDPAILREALGRHAESFADRRPLQVYEEETERRLRPFARRRFRTWRPFLVAIRTRNPCVRLRRRRFGWNVTLIVGSPAAIERRLRNPDRNQRNPMLSIRVRRL